MKLQPSTPPQRQGHPAPGTRALRFRSGLAFFFPETLFARGIGARWPGSALRAKPLARSGFNTPGRSKRKQSYGLAGPVLAALSTALLLSSCAITSNEESAASRPGRIARFPHNMANADCFFQNRIDNFEVLNETNLLVFEGRRRVYHVEISPPSMGLRHAYGIQFRSSTGRVCGNPGERLQLSSGSYGAFPLAVTGVYRLDAVTQTAVRAHFSPVVARPPLPEDENAAAIEELATGLYGEAAPAGEEPQASSPGEDQES